MQIGSLDSLSYKTMEPAWEPFFAQFPTEFESDEKRKIMQGIIEESARMIAKTLERQKKLYKEVF